MRDAARSPITTRLAGLLLPLLIAACAAPPHTSPPGSAPSTEPASVRLERLSRTTLRAPLELLPTSETPGAEIGPRQDRLEPGFTAENRARQRRHHEAVLAELRTIAVSPLNATDRLTHRLLQREAELGLAGLDLPLPQHTLLIPVDGGIAVDLVKLAGRQPMRHEADARAWFRRLARYPAFFDGAVQVLKDGIATGQTIPRPVVERCLAQLDALAPADDDPTGSALWSPITRLPASLDAATRSALQAEYRHLLAADVLPAARRLTQFVRTEYLPHARTSAGLVALPGGAAIYRHQIRRHATVDMGPDRIHELGLQEVKRIQGLLAPAMSGIGYSGRLSDFRGWLRQQPEYYPFKAPQDVLDHLNRLHARILPRLPALFGQLPKARLEIRATDPAIAAAAPAQWYPPSSDGTRPGIFALPIMDAERRSTLGLASLLLHEGMPGHHLDGTLRRELGLSAYRRQVWISAFGEGWALYAESLGHELGLYDEPAALLGRYLDELYRAGRLVADTGLHAKGWTRAQAIRYLVDECAQVPGNAANEVDRYLAWPAQALGYKLGEMTITTLRRDAERQLGPRFDLRAFHDALLAQGHLPLDLLRERMNAWIAAGGR